MRKTLLVRSSVIALALSGTWVAYIQAQQTASKLDTVKLADNLYAIHNDFVPGNTTVLITNEGVIVVDDKFPVDANNVIAAIKKLTNQPIKYVINTHHHGDHSGGNPAMVKLGAQIVSSEEARANMVDGKMPGLPNVTFEHHADIYLGGQHVELYHYGRAHTDGDAVVLFPQQRVLASGDIFAFGDRTPELIDYSGGGSAKDWPATLTSALKLDFDKVVPGHGVVTTKLEMSKFRDSTIRLRNRVHEMIAANKSKADIEKMLRTEFHFADLHVQYSLNGLLEELR